MNEDRGLFIAFIILAAAIVFGGVVVITNRPAPVEIVLIPPDPTGTPVPSATPAPITVYVTGAVNSPQMTVNLPVGSRVSEAIEGAGGLLDDADVDRVNMAGIVRDGDHIHVYAMGEPELVALPTPGGGGLVFVNSATEEELITLPGIGPVTAGRIIDYRNEHGPFSNASDLENVAGIGPATIAGLLDFVSFE